jgi:two-component system KDP operon response regulator KdpE
MTRILLIDDEPQILRALSITLRARHYEVDTATCGRRALAAAANRPPDLVVLDLGLPDLDGVEVIQSLRGWTSVPIIVLSGRSDPREKVAALDAGADDYITKPFGMDELLARLRAAFRRAISQPDVPSVTIGDYLIDLAARRVTVLIPRDGVVDLGAAMPSQDVRLTPTEWGLLEQLIRNPGRLITHRQLLDEVWGPGGYPPENDYLRVYLARLRRKLEPDPSRPRYLITEPGIGYRLQP